MLFDAECGPGLTCTNGSGDQVIDGPWVDCVPAACYYSDNNLDGCDGDDLLLRMQMDTGEGARAHCPDYGFATCADGACRN